ncbi:MAG: pyruvate dehydrogenase (acetyl-transferring) E1 component subunit alpha [Candidatus Micrarchaeota archaeon]|nr:pyruvate dehydrogenase (acetyl-transferring) E1 component subunit alpha [Candidatus Micrarchaeota archaeon]
MQKRVFDGSVDYVQVMDENGSVDQALMPKDLADSKIVDMYRFMCLARALDDKTLSLQRQGRAVTYAPLTGEEATQVGSALAMRPGDLFVPSFRQHGVFLARGLPIEIFFLYEMGFEDGNHIPEGVGGFPVCIPVGSQMPHAAGIAFAQKQKKTGAAVISYVGDGGTSEGDFYETINFAGVFKLPLVAIVENNQWAISMPRSSQTAAITLAQKAIAAGIRCVQVDGNDPIAVYESVKEAIQLSGDGPTVIECVTYRMSMHTTADDPSKYRSDDEVASWRAKDPIERTRKYLISKSLWNDDMEQSMRADHKKTIDAAVEKAEQFKPDPKSMFESVYSSVEISQILKGELDDAVESNFYQV